MLPFGRLEVRPGTQSQVMSRLMASLESAGCEVSREGEGRLSVLVPGWDAALFPCESALPLQQLFWDRMVISVGAEGSARYRLQYWSGLQPLLHLVIAAAFAGEAWLGSLAALDPLRAGLVFALAQLVPVALTLATFGISRRAVLRKALSPEGARATG